VDSVAPSLVTEAEYLALPETTQRMELVDGEVIVAPSPSFWHQEILARIVTSLRAWASLQPQPPTVAQAPLDVRFAVGRILQPDAMVFLTPIERDIETPLDVVPDLCVEVLSSNRAYDRVTKRYLYAEAGVVEYWLVDPAGSVERRFGDALAKAEQTTRRLTTPLLPGFELDLPSLFAL
jgi:Uma2 family endonuclease